MSAPVFRQATGGGQGAFIASLAEASDMRPGLPYV